MKKLIVCGDSFTQGEGLKCLSQTWGYQLSKILNYNYTNYAQSGASEFLIYLQVKKAIKQKPDLIIVAHTSEYRWHIRKTNGDLQGFLVANFLKDKNNNQNRNWILSEQLLGSSNKAAWHGAGMLYYSEPMIAVELWKSFIANQELLLQKSGIPYLHMVCFPHLHSSLEEITDKAVPIHLDKLKLTIDMAPDGSHAGPESHKFTAKALSQVISQSTP